MDHITLSREAPSQSHGCHWQALAAAFSGAVHLNLPQPPARHLQPAALCFPQPILSLVNSSSCSHWSPDTLQICLLHLLKFPSYNGFLSHNLTISLTIFQLAAFPVTPTGKLLGCRFPEQWFSTSRHCTSQEHWAMPGDVLGCHSSG